MSTCASVIPIAPASAAQPAWDSLIQNERVHGSLYTDPQIYQEELRKIWFRT